MLIYASCDRLGRVDICVFPIVPQNEPNLIVFDSPIVL